MSVTSSRETEPAPAHPSSGGAQRDSVTIRVQRWVWDRRAGGWDHATAPGLGKVVDAIVEAAAAKPGDEAVDLGCGTGQVALPLADAGATVTAVDVSRHMVDLLEEKAATRAPGRIRTVTSPIEHLRFPPDSMDLVVSSYALHHLRDADKQAVVRAAAGWLRPGGRLVVGDMMFGRGATSRDRSIIASKAKVMLGRGPAGWWRLAKNAVRFTIRIQERPVSLEAWVGYFREAGLADVTAIPVVAEAAVVVGTRR